MTNAVLKFNQKRNQLEFDKTLEINMFNEEVKEFFDANTLAERVDAYVDAEYVEIGTKLKCAYNGVPHPYNQEAINVFQVLGDILSTELQLSGYNPATVITNARKIVCECNALKGDAKDKDGKVVKDDAYKASVNATAQIQEMLDSILTRPEDENDGAEEHS